MRLPRLTSLLLGLVVAAAAPAAPVAHPEGNPPVSWPLGGAAFAGWTGLEPAEAGVAELGLPGQARYSVPAEGPASGASSTLDASAWYGLRFDLALDRDDRPFVGELTLVRPPVTGRKDMIDSTRAPLRLEGKGWHAVTLPFTAFDYPRGQRLVLNRLAEIVLAGRYEGADGASGRIRLRNVRLVRGDVVHLDAPVRSLPAEGDATVAYPVDIANCSDTPQLLNLALRPTGWEGMPASVTPDHLTIAPGASATAVVSVTVPAWLPPGAREPQTLAVIPQGSGQAAETLALITSRRLPFPHLVHDAAGWDAVRANARDQDWARDQLAAMVRKSEALVVPPPNAPDQRGVFKAYVEREVWPAAVAWKLTGERRHAEKFALFLRRLADPATGYPSKAMANAADIPQEGGLWEAAACGYDLIQDAGVLTPEDTRLIEASFRRYIDWVAAGNGHGGISNWSLFNLCPAGLCALALQDFARFDELMHGSGGIVDHMRFGIMDDGWWYEMSLSYNLECARALTTLGLAARPFGIDFLNEKIPVATTRIVGLRPFEFSAFKGMAFGKYGPVRDNFVTLKKMWDGIAAYPDYRGVMFGMGDGHEEHVSGQLFDRAYYAFRDPAYATVLKQGGERDLLYGFVPLPADSPPVYTRSTHSDNAGLALLRSQTPGRPASAQIQAVLKYGTHGSYHGHFDRLALNSLMRFGRSFYNPETSWYGYPSYMYKWWVQVSLSHNLVVVDAKMQEPTECVPLLFHSGSLFQAAAAGTTARWSNPPYLGGYEREPVDPRTRRTQVEEIRAGDLPWVPIPENYPDSSAMTGFTEPVRQRRLTIVTDDYVLLADDLLAEKTHTYDNLLHLRGARLESAPAPRLLRHDAQFDSDPLGSGQFITNVSRYTAGDAPAVFRSVHRVGENKMGGPGWNGDARHWETGGASSLSEPGELHLDAHVLWPPRPELALGDYAESWKVGKKLAYAVTGDGRVLAEGVFGAWILGEGRVEAGLAGVKTLALATRAGRGRDTLRTVFWADAALVTADGREIPLATLQPAARNVAPVPTPGFDYEGGPVRIAGTPALSSIPAEPADDNAEAVLTYDLAGLGAVRLVARVGGDWPVGDEEQLRKVCAVRATGPAAQFLTLLEPYEKAPLVKAATATGPGAVRVELNDGRVQEIAIAGLDAAGDAPAVSVTLVESRNGEVLRRETTLH